jgi:D-inositol-3-phosphate glycosyltransferase
MSGIASAALKHPFGIPFAITFHALGRVRCLHQGENDAFPPGRNEIEDMLVRFADRVIAVCPQDVEDLRRLYHADAERMTCMPCGFGGHEFGALDRAAARQRLGLAPNEFVVLQLGRLVPRKCVDTVIRAMAPLRRRLMRPVRLLIVGGNSDAPDERATPAIARLREVARQAGVADVVNFAGRTLREELRRYYNAADVFVTTPWYEPFGITPLEAMACGTPVVGSRVGGIQETVVDKVTGLLVPPREPAELATAVLQLAESPAYARALGRAGRARARRRYSWQRVTDELESVYEAIVMQEEEPLEQEFSLSTHADESAEALS